MNLKQSQERVTVLSAKISLLRSGTSVSATDAPFWMISKWKWQHFNWVQFGPPHPPTGVCFCTDNQGPAASRHCITDLQGERTREKERMETAKVSPGHDFYTVNMEEKQRTCASAHGRRATGKNDVIRDARVGKGRKKPADSSQCEQKRHGSRRRRPGLCPHSPV